MKGSTTTERQVEFKSLFTIPCSFWKRLDILQMQERRYVQPVALTDELDDSDEELEKSQVQEYDKEIQRTCRACGLVFTTGLQGDDEQRKHFKTGWHRSNLKRRAEGEKALSKSEFESGAKESSQSDSTQPKHYDGTKPKNTHKVILYTSDQRRISFCRNILPCQTMKPALDLSSLSGLMKRIAQMSVEQTKHRWCFILSGGGRFAAAVYNNEGKLLKHKKFHRYTVRKKQGGSQSIQDRKGGKAKSAGAFMRRYHEVKLRQEIQELLVSWKKDIAKCDVVFLGAPKGITREVLFFDGSPLGPKARVEKGGIGKIRSIPVAVRRPCLTEIQRVQKLLACVEIQKISDEEFELLKTNPEQVENQHGGEVVSEDTLQETPIHSTDNPESSDDEDDEGLQEERALVEGLLQKVKDAIIANDATVLQNTLDPLVDIASECQSTDIFLEIPKLLHFAIAQPKASLPIIQTLINHESQDIDYAIEEYHFRTVLHQAIESNQKAVVLALLDHGADIAAKGLYGKQPYALCKNKDLREAIRIYAGSDRGKQYDWQSVGIVPLTKAMMDARKSKAKQKRKRKKNRKKVQQTQAKAQQKVEEQVTQVMNQWKSQVAKKNALSDREKRARAAEDRMNGTFNTITKCTRPGCKDFIEYGDIPLRWNGMDLCSESCVRLAIQSQST